MQTQNSFRPPGHCRHLQKQLTWLIAVIFLLVACGGCATMKKKFTPSTKANIGLFADNTIAILDDLELDMSRNETVITRRFFNPSEPEERRVLALADQTRKGIGRIVQYSISLVSLSESSGTEQDKVAAYADYVATFKSNIVQRLNMDPHHYDALIDDIRRQSDLLSALQTAQPILNRAVMDGIMRLSELSAAIGALAEKIDGKIEAEYADIIRYHEKLEDEKFFILSAFETIYDAYRTDSPDLSGLAKSGVIWIPEIIPKGRPTQKELREIAKHLQGRMNAMHKVQQEIQSDWEEYRSGLREVDNVATATVERINRIRLILLVWVRAHQKMASGVVESAEWFDINDAPRQLINLGMKSL